MSDKLSPEEIEEKRRQARLNRIRLSGSSRLDQICEKSTSIEVSGSQEQRSSSHSPTLGHSSPSPQPSSGGENPFASPASAPFIPHQLQSSSTTSSSTLDTSSTQIPVATPTRFNINPSSSPPTVAPQVSSSKTNTDSLFRSIRNIYNISPYNRRLWGTIAAFIFGTALALMPEFAFGLISMHCILLSLFTVFLAESGFMNLPIPHCTQLAEDASMTLFFCVLVHSIFVSNPLASIPATII